MFKYKKYEIIIESNILLRMKVIHLIVTFSHKVVCLFFKTAIKAPKLLINKK